MAQASVAKCSNMFCINQVWYILAGLLSSDSWFMIKCQVKHIFPRFSTVFSQLKQVNILPYQIINIAKIKG